MATIKYFIKTISKNSLANIYVRVKHGRSIDMTAKTEKFVLPDYWNPNSETIRPKADIKDKDAFTGKLIELRRHIEDELGNIKDKNNPEKDWLKIAIQNFWNPDLTPTEMAHFLKISMVTLWHWDRKQITRPLRVGN